MLTSCVYRVSLIIHNVYESHSNMSEHAHELYSAGGMSHQLTPINYSNFLGGVVKFRRPVTSCYVPSRDYTIMIPLTH